MEYINTILDSVVDVKSGTTVKEEIQKIGSLGANFVEEKLKKAGIENHKLLSEIEEKYANAEKIKAEARKTDAETRKIDAETRKLKFEQSIKELTTSLKLTKIITLQQNGVDVLVAVKEIDDFIAVLESISGNQLLL